MKYLLIILGLIIIFLIIRLMDKENPLIGTIEQTDLELIAENQPEKRPDGIPETAVWRGGLDGGVYIVLPKLVQAGGDIYYAEIYNDHSGALFYKGRYRFVYPENAVGDPVDPTRTDINMGWDGERLYLNGTNQYLKPLDPHDKD